MTQKIDFWSYFRSRWTILSVYRPNPCGLYAPEQNICEISNLIRNSSNLTNLRLCVYMSRFVSSSIQAVLLNLGIVLHRTADTLLCRQSNNYKPTQVLCVVWTQAHCVWTVVRAQLCADQAQAHSVWKGPVCVEQTNSSL